MDAVATCPTADGHDQVAGECFFPAALNGNKAYRAAEDQGVGEIAFIEADRSIHGGNSHPVAVVAHAGHDALDDFQRMKHARGQGFDARLGRGETENVRIAYRLGTQAGAKRIANHAAQTRVGPAVRLNGRWMIMRLYLEANMILVVKAHDAGIIFENADAPIIAAEPAADVARGFKDGFLEKVVKMPAFEVDFPLERLVRAMLRPGLRQGFQLDVGRLASQASKMFLNRSHLGEAKRKLTLAAEPRETRFIEIAQRHLNQVEPVRCAECEMLRRDGAFNYLFNRVIGQHLRQHRMPGSLSRRLTAKEIAAKSAHRSHRDAEVVSRIHHAQRRGIHDAGFEDYRDRGNRRSPIIILQSAIGILQ